MRRETETGAGRRISKECVTMTSGGWLANASALASMSRRRTDGNTTLEVLPVHEALGGGEVTHSATGEGVSPYCPGNEFLWGFTINDGGTS